MENKHTTPEATKSAALAALDELDGNPAEKTAPNAEATAKTPDVVTAPSAEPDPTKVVSEEDALAAAKAAEAKAPDEPKVPEEPESEEDIDEILDKKVPTIPAYRLKKKADQAKKAETELEKERRLSAEKDEKIAALEAEKQSGEDPDEEDEFLTEDGEKALREKGYVKKDEVMAEVDARIAERDDRNAMRQQIRSDVVDLTREAKENGYPAFKLSEVVAYAEQEFGPEVVLTGKNLKAAYTSLHLDAITEARVKARLATAENPASAEKPKGAVRAPAASAANSSGQGSWRDRVAETVDSVG